MPGQYIIGQGQIKAGFKISAILPARNRQKCFWVEKINTLPVCLSWKMVIHADFAQLNYGLHVFDIVKPYQRDLIHLCGDLRLLPCLYSFCIVELWFECFEYYPYIQMWQYMLICGVGARPVAHWMK